MSSIEQTAASHSQATAAPSPSQPPIDEPVTFKDAVKFPEWCEAMNVELAALKANGTWEVVPLPSNKKTVSYRWFYKVKYHSDGQLDQYKICLVAKGFTQTAKMDYFETFSSVVKMTSFRLLMTIAAMHKWDITQLDVTNAFFHGTLDEEVYMSFPPCYSVPASVQDKYPGQRLVCHLLKSLYGLKQAPRQWFIALPIALLSFGFKQTNGGPSLFVYSHSSDMVYLLIYVDDMVMIGNSSKLMAQITDFLSTEFKIKDLGFLNYFLGIQVSRMSHVSWFVYFLAQVCFGHSV